ncbi:MAG: cadmium-translocating P-type ATPase [Chthoniobacterales bacterium]|nr:cadmium-translocating P-type ATPase [Chthoniobacterales bacterium]
MSACCGHGEKQQPAATATGGPYICPMHPEVVRDRPGDCPVCGMALEPARGATDDGGEMRDMTRRLAVAAALAIPVVAMAMAHMVPSSAFAHWSHGTAARWWQAILSTPVLFWCGWPFLRRAWQSLLNRSPNMFTLIATGTLAAWGFSMSALVFPGWASTDAIYFEAAAVIITLVLAGQVLELRARRRTGDALRALMDLAPATAWLVQPDDSAREVPLPDVSVGDILRVKPGGKVPVDGEVTAGRSTLDESMLTGESMPVEISPGAKVRAGTINGSGAFDLRTVAVGPTTMLSQIVELVALAQRARAPVEDLADRVAAVFVPAVAACALLSFASWILLTGSWSMAVTASVAVLIIACPCAIGLAVPVSIAVGVGRAARLGVLVRQPSALERLEHTDTLCLDKTGTLTEGRPEVAEVVCAPGVPESEVWSLAAALESRSEHPLGAAVVRGAEALGLKPAAVEDFFSSSGGGVGGRVKGAAVRAGTPEFAGIAGPDNNEARSRIDVSANGEWMGTFFLADRIKPSARAALEKLRAGGVRTVMLTGDREPVARLVASELGIGEFRAGMTPQAKAAAVEEMRAQGRHVCMAGDGVNDAPALAAADTSIAMGAGSDVAKEAADLVLVHGSLDGVVRAFALGRAIMRNVRQNLFLAFAYNVLGIPIAAGLLYPVTGWLLDPMMAGAAMSLSSVSVIANALRLNRSPKEK